MTDDVIKDLEAAVRTKEALHETFIKNIEGRLKQQQDRIERLKAALREIKELHHGPENKDVSVIDSIFMRDDRTYKIVCDTLEREEDE